MRQSRSCKEDVQKQEGCEGRIIKRLHEGDIDSQEEQDSEEEYVLHHLPAKPGVEPYSVTVLIEGKSLQMEVDTGAVVSLVSEGTFRQLWPEKEIKKSVVRLCTYLGESLPILGELEVAVALEGQVNVLPLLVLKGKGPSLLGRKCFHR